MAATFTGVADNQASPALPTRSPTTQFLGVSKRASAIGQLRGNFDYQSR